MKTRAFVTLTTSVLIAAAPPKPATAYEDVAEVSTSACFEIASGHLTLASPASDEYADQLAKKGLARGIDQTALDMLGPATALVSRSSMGQRKNGPAYIIIAANGPLPGCRVILAADPQPAAMDEVATALVKPALGWKSVPELTETRGVATKRVFLRRDKVGKPYMLNLVGLAGVPGKVQLFTTTIAVPPNVSLPAGF
ncbi:MAG TPA: hypothetical protein VF637_11335 [Sphingomicrobium sp.]